MTVDPERADASDLESMEDEEENQTTKTKAYNQQNLLAALQDRINEFNIDVILECFLYCMLPIFVT